MATLEEIQEAIKNSEAEQQRIMNAIMKAIPEDVYFHNVHIALARMIVVLVESKVNAELVATQESEEK